MLAFGTAASPAAGSIFYGNVGRFGKASFPLQGERSRGILSVYNLLCPGAAFQIHFLLPEKLP